MLIGSRFRTGYICGLVLLSLEFVIAFIVNLIFNRLPLGLTLIFVAFSLASIFLLYRKRKYLILSEYAHVRVQCVLFLFSGLFTSIIFDSAQVFIYTLAYSTAATFIYLDFKLAKFQMWLNTVLLFLMTIILLKFVKSPQSLSEFFFGIISVFINNWINIIIIYFISYQQRNSFEHERSLDDLLAVVEIKCDEARAATKSQSRFLANMSHEIRTPINTIIGMNEMIKRESNQDAVLSYATDVDVAAQSLLTIINDILDLSQIEEGKISLVPVNYSLFWIKAC